MFGRERKFGRRDQHADRDQHAQHGGNVMTAERTAAPPAHEPARHDRPAAREEHRAVHPSREPAVAHDRDARLRQRERFGGFNKGAAFFGWIVAIGIGALLTAIVAAAGAAIGLTSGTGSDDAATVGIVGGALLIAVALVAYYAGGYVAGRMSRFDGGRQGLGVWVLGLLVTVALAVAGAILGSEYNVLEQLNLPRIPVSTGDLTAGGAITLLAIALGSLIASVAGGKVGERYHRRVDRAAFADERI
jgi:hypothetical protein